MRIALALALLLAAAPASAQTPEPVPLPVVEGPVTTVTPDEWRRLNQLIVHSPPTIRERIDMALIIGSAAAASTALGITLACTATHECRELNPVMRRVIGDGTTRAAIVKPAINAATLYATWRTTTGKTRTIALAVIFAVNAIDAVHDIRQMREIERRRVIAVSVPVF